MKLKTFGMPATGGVRDLSCKRCRNTQIKVCREAKHKGA